MIEDKKYEKRQVSRAVEELAECLRNVLKASRDQYPNRIRQLFTAIKKNEVLDIIITPYIEMNIDYEKIGFLETKHSLKMEMVLPENEDEEIALILNILIVFAENESTIDQHTFRLSMINNFEESLFNFNETIVEPAFKKLQRKLKYKLEDMGAKPGNEVNTGDIMIINIKEIKASKSMVAIGKNITLQNENIFEKIRNEIYNNVENENDKKELLSYISEMEKNKADKEIFRTYYDRFINRLGTYMTIIGPLLPFLVDYFK
jgi:hypothetical protein